MEPTRKHRQSWDIKGNVHCLTFSTFRRQSFFTGKHAGTWFQEAIVDARRRSPFHLFAYVIMPEHVHLVLQPLPGVMMRGILWQLKCPMAQRVLGWVRKNHPEYLKLMADVQPSGKTAHRFWQRGGGYDRNLRSPSDVNEKIRYIHENPVRRGLVSRPEDCPLSSASQWITNLEGPVSLNLDALPEPELR